MNAIDILKEDHRIVDGLFKEVENTTPSRHPALFKRIKGELDTHAHIEEVIFYPALKKRGDKELVGMVLEGLEEHSQMKKFLAEIDAISIKNERYEPKLKVLIEDTRHHVKEEERMRTGMFAMAERQLGEAAMEKLGTRIEAEKKKFQNANGIVPEKREAPKSSLETLVEKAREVVADIFTGGSSGADNAKAPAAAKPSNGRGNRKSGAKSGGATSKPRQEREQRQSAGPRKENRNAQSRGQVDSCELAEKFGL